MTDGRDDQSPSAEITRWKDASLTRPNASQASSVMVPGLDADRWLVEEPIPADYRLLPPAPTPGESKDLASVFTDWEAASFDQTLRSRTRLIGRQEADAAREERLELRRIDVAFQINASYLNALKDVWLKQIDLEIKTVEQETLRLSTRQDFKDRRNARRAESRLVKLKGRLERDRLELVQPYEIDLKEVESRLRIEESKDIQPIEVQKLLIQAMGRYGEMREKALDEAIRNPALRDQLRSRAMGYQEMQEITRETIAGLMSSDLPPEAKKTLMAEYLKRMGQHTEDYLKKL